MASVRRDSLLLQSVEGFFVRRVSVEIAPVGSSVADAATALAAQAATMVSSLLPEADKNSLLSNFLFTNAQAVAGAIMATVGLLVVRGLMGLLLTPRVRPKWTQTEGMHGPLGTAR